MKLAIGICERVNGVCSTSGCFRAYNNKSAHFEEYKDQDTSLLAFFTCQFCSSQSWKGLEKISKRLEKNQVERVHLGACAVKCKAGLLEEIKEVFQNRNISLVEGTH